MKKTKIKEKSQMVKKIKVDRFGQIPLEIDVWIQDNAFQKIKVDYCWLRNVLIRLTDLQRLTKNHLAESDIPKCVEYMLSVVPPKVLKKLTSK